MNMLRLSTLSLTLAIAVFSLGYNPSFADNPRTGDCAPEHCPHGDDNNTGTTFSVEVITASEIVNGVDTRGDTVGGCEGTSTPSNQLSAKFLKENRDDCGPVMIMGPDGSQFYVYLLEIAVQEKKNGDTVRFFFTEMATPQYAGQEFVWNSDSLPALISPTDDGLEITGIDGSWTGIHLTKTHQPDKRFVSTEPGGITAGKMVYTPEPE